MHLHEVILHCTVDKSLIGGIKVKINNITLDDTIKNKLSKMKQSIFELHHGK
jgi:F0F1-type ATP synthase delta subunit